MNVRLNQIFCKFDICFDDFNILFCDDFEQFISIGDFVLYNENNLSIDFLIYRVFQHIIVLKEIMRQKKQNERVRFFRRILNQIRDEFIDKINYDFFVNRNRFNISQKK